MRLSTARPKEREGASSTTQGIHVGRLFSRDNLAESSEAAKRSRTDAAPGHGAPARAPYATGTYNAVRATSST